MWDGEKYLHVSLSHKRFKRDRGPSPILYISHAVLRIQTLLIRIRILLFTLIRIQIFNLIRIRPFDTDPDPYRFKEVMYLKQYFLHNFT
jgi:hypothetical protein